MGSALRVRSEVSVAMDDLWLNIGAIVAGIAVMVGWHYAQHGSTDGVRRAWNIVRFASLGYLIMWLILLLPTIIDVFTDGA